MKGWPCNPSLWRRGYRRQLRWPIGKGFGCLCWYSGFPPFLWLIRGLLTNGQKNLTVVFVQHGKSGFSLLKQEDPFYSPKDFRKGLLLAWSHLCCRKSNIKFENWKGKKTNKQTKKNNNKITSYLIITTNTPPLLIKVDCRICIASSIDTVSGLKIETVVNRRFKKNQ